MAKDTFQTSNSDPIIHNFHDPTLACFEPCFWCDHYLRDTKCSLDPDKNLKEEAYFCKYFRLDVNSDCQVPLRAFDHAKHIQAYWINKMRSEDEEKRIREQCKKDQEERERIIHQGPIGEGKIFGSGFDSHITWEGSDGEVHNFNIPGDDLKPGTAFDMKEAVNNITEYMNTKGADLISISFDHGGETKNYSVPGRALPAREEEDKSIEEIRTAIRSLMDQILQINSLIGSLIGFQSAINRRKI